MLRSAAVLVLVLALGLLLAAPAAQASTRVTSAYAYFAKTTDGSGGGYLWIAFRTDRRLPLDVNGAPILEGTNGPYVISRKERCYGDSIVYNQGVPVPSHVRLRLGKGGSAANIRLRVLKVRPGYGQGGLIGCTRDVSARVYTTVLTFDPLVRPGSLWLDQGIGPRLEGLHWHGWGTRRAVGYGSYMAGVPGSEPSETALDVRPARFILSRPRMCSEYGAPAYTRFTLITWDGHYKRHVKRRSVSDGCQADVGSFGVAR